MNYEIYGKKEISKDIYEPKNASDLTSWSIGKIDLNNLQLSKFNPLLSEIPDSSMKELKVKGETVFTIITKQTIVIRNKKED